MNQITDSKKEELYELVSKQKKAKISWIAVITQLSEDDIREIAWDMGLSIDGDTIMLFSETEEGKKETILQENYQRMVQLAIDERVIRRFFGGPSNVIKNISDDITNTGYIEEIPSFALANLLGLANLIIMFRQEISKGPDSMKFGKVKNCVCNLDGSVSCTITKSTEMKSVKKELYETLTKHYDQKFHYLIPIKSYFELIVLPTKDDKIKTSDQKKTLAFCERLDFHILKFCEKIIQESIIKEKKILSKLYNVILSSGEKTTVSQGTIEQTKYSLYLSYRNHLNQIFYEMVNSSDFSDLIDFINENLFSNDSKLIGNIFSLFKKKYPWVI